MAEQGGVAAETTTAADEAPAPLAAANAAWRLHGELRREATARLDDPDDFVTHDQAVMYDRRLTELHNRVEAGALLALASAAERIAGSLERIEERLGRG